MIILKKVLRNLFYLFLPFLIGGLCSLIIKDDVLIYKKLNLPKLSPPGYLFGIVWPILYLLIGVSYYLLKKKAEDYDISEVSFWYYLQLIINFFWSIFFFKNQMFLFSVFWLLLLIVVVVVMFIKFYKINKLSSYILIPYLIWLLFALYLNLGVVILN